MGWWLRTLIALAKDLSLVCRIHISQFVTAGTCAVGISWLQWALGLVLILTHVHTLKKKSRKHCFFL